MKKLAFVIIVACLAITSCKREDEPPTICSTVDNVEAIPEYTTCVVSCKNKSVDGKTIKMRILLSESESMRAAESYTMDLQSDSLRYNLTDLTMGCLYYYCFELYTANDSYRIKKVYQFRTKSLTQPNVITLNPENITSSSAVCGGEVIDDGGSEVTERGILWNVGNTLSSNYNKVTLGSGLGSFSTTLTSLAGGTTYCYMAYAVNGTDTALGNLAKFTTTATIPTVTTSSVSNITSSAATCGGNVTSDGGATVNARGVCWSTSPNPTISGNHTTNGTGTGSFTSSLTGLTAGTTYYVRAYATNAAGTAYGSQKTFTTTSVPVSFAFSVSASTRVLFSPGNLQWSATGGGSTATTHTVAGGGTAAGTWRFAPNQWDAIGSANSNISSSCSGWIDLFGWGTSGYHDSGDQYNTNYQPYSTSAATVNNTYNFYGYGPSTNMTNPDISGTNYDWGVYNAIYNPRAQTTDAPGTWRTLTYAEWSYLINTRSTTSGIRYAKATVNGVPGLIIVPDNWSATTYALNSTNTVGAAYTTNVITSAQWTTLETAGCAFLPAAGLRNGTLVSSVGSYGYCWSASYDNSSNAYGLYFVSGHVSAASGNRCYGRSVRLVMDVK